MTVWFKLMFFCNFCELVHVFILIDFKYRVVLIHILGNQRLASVLAPYHLLHSVLNLSAVVSLHLPLPHCVCSGRRMLIAAILSFTEHVMGTTLKDVGLQVRYLSHIHTCMHVCMTYITDTHMQAHTDIYTYIHTNAHMHTHTHTRTHANIRITHHVPHTHTCAHMRTHAHTCTHTCTHMHTHTHARMHARMHAWSHAHMHTRTCTYIHLFFSFNHPFLYSLQQL